jgi:hypothetical protein
VGGINLNKKSSSSAATITTPTTTTTTTTHNSQPTTQHYATHPLTCATVKLKTSLGPMTTSLGVRPLKKAPKPSFFTRSSRMRVPDVLSLFWWWWGWWGWGW